MRNKYALIPIISILENQTDVKASPTVEHTQTRAHDELKCVSNSYILHFYLFCSEYNLAKTCRSDGELCPVTDSFEDCEVDCVRST
jgi:hypothetical protein